MDRAPTTTPSTAQVSIYTNNLLREVPSPLDENVRRVEENSRSPLATLKKLGMTACSKAVNLKEGIVEIVTGVGHDFSKTPKSMINTSFAGLAITATQYADRVREPFVQASRHATEHLAHGSPYFIDGLQNSAEAGLIFGGTLGVSYFLIGESVRWATKAYPTATEAIVSRFPRAYKVAKYSTAGIVSKQSVDRGHEESRTKHYAKSLYGQAKRTLGYGWQGLGMGTAAQAAVSTIEGWPGKRSHSLIAKTSGSIAGLSAALVMAADTSTDALVRNGHTVAAERIVSTATNRYSWLVLAGIDMATRYNRNTKIANGEITR